MLLKIRTEKESEVDQITEIHHLTFNGPDEGKIVENLRRNRNLTISLVCEISGRLAGHIAYSPISNKNGKTVGLGLAPVAVLPSLQNQGIGSRLIKHGNKNAFDMGFRSVFVLGDPEYYCRFGFVLAKEYDYYCKFDPEGNHFMVLGPQAKEPEATVVYYCEEFDV